MARDVEEVRDAFEYPFWFLLHNLPCPRCGAKVLRIRYADNETHYCAVCQNGGKVLADRALSRLVREDWPRTLEELEELRKAIAPLPRPGARS